MKLQSEGLLMKFIKLSFSKLHLVTITSLTVWAFGCSHSVEQEEHAHNWLAHGSLVLSRPAPEIKELSPTTNMFGFLPSLNNGDQVWLSVKKNEKKLYLMEGKKSKLTIKSQQLSELPSGVYEVMHKQRHPVWHATNEYFAQRKLVTPPEGDGERLLRGVLGEFALFLDKDLPIHSGPVQLPEIGGIQLPEDDIARIYYHLEIGAPVVVE